MPDDNNLIPQNEMPASTTDEVLRLLSEQSAQSNGDDLLENPELERLFGSLSEGLDEGLLEGAQPTAVLTLEQLVLGAPAAPAGETVTCSDCGSRNPAATRFCGMCGHALDKSSAVAAATGNGNDHAAELAAVPEPASQLEAAAIATAGKGWKLGLLALLCIVLSLVVYQQLTGQLPLWNRVRSLAAPPAPALSKAPPAPTSLMSEPVPAPADAQSATSRPSPVAKPSPSKPAPPASESPVSEPPTQAAPVGGSSAAPAPSSNAVKQEAQERAPAISMPAVPIELPTIVPPSSSPVLQGTRPAAPREPAAAKISAGVIPGALIFKVNPQIPPNARSAGIRGSVVLQAAIGIDGGVQQLRVLSGDPRLANAAIEAVKKWRYRPFMLDGKPVEGETTITLNFKGE